MTTFYVAKTGNDSNAGTDPDAPKLTITSACAAVNSGNVSGSTIQIFAGTYNESTINLYTSQDHDGLTFEAATGSDGEFEEVILSGDNSASDYIVYSYANELSWNNLTFTNLLHVPSRPGGGATQFSMSGCLVHTCGNGAGTTVNPGGDSDYISKIESCRIFSMQGRALSAANYTEVNNCLIVSDDEDSIVLSLDGAYSTASFCTIIGSDTGYLAKAAKIINCIVSGTNSTDNIYGSDNNYVGAKGISTDDSSYNIVIVDYGAYWNADSVYLHTASTTEKTLVLPYFTNPGALGSSNYLTDDYTLVAFKTVDGVVPTSYFTCEDGTGTNISDVSAAGNNRRGSLVGGVTWDSHSLSPIGTYSLSFSGVDGYVILDEVSQDLAGGNYSAFAWIRTNVASGNGGHLWAIQEPDGSPRLESKLWLGKYYAAPPNNVLNSPGQTLADEKWHHVGYTFNWDSSANRGIASYYLDGTVVNSHSSSGGVLASDDTLRVGCRMGSGGTSPENFFRGNIDELSFWNKALEPEHIQALYDAGNADTSKEGGFSTAKYDNTAQGAGIVFGTPNVVNDVIFEKRRWTRGHEATIGAYGAPFDLWREHYSEPKVNFNNAFVINTFKNLNSNQSLTNIPEQLPMTPKIEQTPFSFGVKGPMSLRRIGNGPFDMENKPIPRPYSSVPTLPSATGSRG